MDSRLRIYFMQHWFNLSDPGMEDSLYAVPCKASPQYKLTEANKRFNRKMSSIRSRVEQVFRGAPLADAEITTRASTRRRQRLGVS